MRYKLVSRIIDGRETVGYIVMDESGQEAKVSKQQLVDLALKGIVLDIKYNNGHIIGVNGNDLRRLKVINIQKDKSNIVKFTNHDLAKAYISKCKLFGVNNIFEYELLDNDRVKLISVLDKDNNGRLELPSFITDIGRSMSRGDDNFYGPLAGCKYSEIYVMNNIGKRFDAGNLCSGMRSKKLKIEFKYPKCVTNMCFMFSGCRDLEVLDVSKLDTSNVEDMSWLFNRCNSLKSVDISNFDTKRVTNMRGMFAYCKTLKRIDLNSINTKEVVDMSYMFYECSSLNKIDIDKLNTSKVVDMIGMFSDCESLELLYINGWDTRNVKNMSSMFYNCMNLKELVADKLDLRNVRNSLHVLNGCYKLDKRRLENFSKLNFSILKDT